MASPNTRLRNWLDNIRTLRREFDAYETRLQEWSQSGSPARARSGVKQRLAFQVGIFLRLTQADPIFDPSNAPGILGYSHFLRVTLLISEDATMDEAVASYHELNDAMVDSAKRWLRSGVDETELAGLVNNLKVEAERVAELGGDPNLPTQGLAGRRPDPTLSAAGGLRDIRSTSAGLPYVGWQLPDSNDRAPTL